MFIEAENFPLRSSDLNPVYFSLWGALHKNCVVNTSDTVVIRSAFYCTAGSDT